jgi:polar amino acid transport system substrate-binding protein
MGNPFRWLALALAVLALSVACAARPARPSAALLKEVAPSGTLRVGVVVGPARSAFFAVQEQGQPSGVTVELGTQLAQTLGVPVEIIAAPNSGELVDKTASGNLDVAFMPVDEERRQRVDFGPAYFVIESTFLVTPSSGLQKLEEVDRSGVRVVAIANTATIRAAQRFLHTASITPAPSIDAALAQLGSGQADALALTHDSLPQLAGRVPGSRILDGAFLRADVAIAVPKNRPLALGYVSDFLQEAKRSGAVAQAFTHAGLTGLTVAR